MELWIFSLSWVRQVKSNFPALGEPWTVPVWGSSSCLMWRCKKKNPQTETETSVNIQIFPMRWQIPVWKNTNNNPISPSYTAQIFAGLLGHMTVLRSPTGTSCLFVSSIKYRKIENTKTYKSSLPPSPLSLIFPQGPSKQLEFSGIIHLTNTYLHHKSQLMFLAG